MIGTHCSKPDFLEPHSGIKDLESYHASVMPPRHGQSAPKTLVFLYFGTIREGRRILRKWFLRELSFSGSFGVSWLVLVGLLILQGQPQHVEVFNLCLGYARDKLGGNFLEVLLPQEHKKAKVNFQEGAKISINLAWFLCYSWFLCSPSMLTNTVLIGRRVSHWQTYAV